ncbi:MAG: DMT family transporter [Alphaproteobacteria bacterium]|nr:MAG: DMT family transporter [Alphaproteobacteria bacterium]
MHKLPISNTLTGMFFIAVGIFLYSLINLVVKDLVCQYSLGQIALFRMGFALLPALYMLRQTEPKRMFATTTLPRLMVIAFTNFVAIILIFKAFSLLPLAEAQTLCFTSIIFATLMALFVLGEKVNLLSATAVFIGFLGILAVVQPHTGLTNMYGVCAALGFAFLDAVTLVNLRILSRDNSGYKVAFYLMFFGTSYLLIVFILKPYLPEIITTLLSVEWVPLGQKDFFRMAFVGLVGGMGQICVSVAYKYAKAVTISPVIYTGVIWGILFDIFLFGRSLTPLLVIGALLVIGSGLLIVYNEHILAKNTHKTKFPYT